MEILGGEDDDDDDDDDYDDDDYWSVCYVVLFLSHVIIDLLPN